MNRKAFTLVELLVVISIIALLLSILVPTLSRTREMAKTLICETHMKELGTAWYAYAVDNDGWMASALNYRSDDDPIRMEYARYSWVWAPTYVDEDRTVPDYIEPTLEQRQEGIKRGKIYPYANDLNVYHCPSDRSGHFRSYSITDCMNGEQHFASGPYKKNWDSLSKLSEIKRPVEKLVFVEEKDFRNYNMDSWIVDAENERAEGDPIPVWHAGKCCFAFADGHSEQRRWAEETVEFYKGLTGFAVYIPETEGGKEDIRWLARGWAGKGY